MTAPRILRPQGSGRFVFFCDHASNYIPAELHDLGLPASELARHIAWDIGAAGVTEALSEIFDAPAILCNASRLVIDCNRHLNASDLIPEVSDGTVIPGNLHLSEAARATRIERWFHPYHDAVESVLLERETRGVQSIAVSIHSMTASLGRQTKALANRSLQPSRPQPCRPGARCAASARRRGGRRQSTIRSGSRGGLQHPIPCTAPGTAAPPGGIPAGRDNGSDGPAPMGSAFRPDVDVTLPIWILRPV